MSGSYQAELSESRTDRTNWRTDLSDAAGHALASLTEALYDNSIPFELNKADNVMLLKDSGSRILLRAVDEFERLRGTNLAWFGLDELTYSQEGAWLRLEGRLRDPKAKRRCGFAVWTPKGFDWVYRRFIQKAVPGYETILAQPYENRFLLEQTPDYYERLKASYDENFFKQEVLGDYLNSKGGLVYPAFSRPVNVRPGRLDPAKPIIWAVDFNVDPMSSVVVQMSRGEYQVLDEIVLKRATTEMACTEFHRRFGTPQAGLTVYGDASGNSMQTTGSSDYGVIRKFFATRTSQVHYKVPPANPPVRDRVGVVNAKLRNALDETELFVDPKCRELIADFEEVSYMEDSTQIDKNKDRRRTHLSDALGYLLWHECRTLPIGEQGRRLI